MRDLSQIKGLVSFAAGADNLKRKEEEMFVPSPPSESSEKDPLGIGQHDPGAKLDDGKIQADELLAMFANALEEVLKVGQFGVRKYSMGSWPLVPNGEQRYADARLRHWIKRKQGEEVAADSGLLHLSHEVWNSLAELELRKRRMKEGR